MRSLLVAALLFASHTAHAADDPQAVIDKAIKAMGGADHLAKFKAEQWKVKGVMQMLGMKINYEAEYYFQLPTQFRFDLTFEMGGQKLKMAAATDGKSAWQSLGEKTEDMDGKKKQAFIDNVYAMSLSFLLPLKDKEFTLASAAEIKVNDKPAVGVKVSRKGQRDVTLYFDKESSLLVKSTTTVWDEFTDKDVPQEVFMIDYKKKDGFMIFNKLIIKKGGGDFIEEEFSDQKPLEKLDPKLFAKP